MISRKSLSVLEQGIPQAMRREKIVGFSIVLIDKASVIWSKAFGYQNADLKAPLTVNSNLEPGSLTKPLFAYCVLKLCEKGVLALDRPLTTYLSEPYLENDPLLDRITARNVLAHTTGLPNWRPDGKPLKILFAPGNRFSYSGEGYQYLQKVVEQLTQQPLESYAKENLFDPLGMTSSLVWSDHFLNDYAHGHNEQGEVHRLGKFLKANAAYSLRGTPEDYAKFVIGLLESPDNEDYFLSEHSLEQMFAPVIPVNDDYPLWDERYPKKEVTDVPHVFWGLGWGLQEINGNVTFWHWGDQYPHYKAFTMGSHEEKTAVIMMSNCYNGSLLFKDVLYEIFGENLPIKNYFDSFYPGYLE